MASSLAFVLLAAMLALPRDAAAVSCGDVGDDGCPAPGTTCFTACDEADVRAALLLVQRCGARDVTVAVGPDADTTCGAPIPLRMDATAPAAAPGACGDDHTNRWNALCLTGTAVVFDGRGAVFEYAGDHACASCSGQCTLCPGESCAHRQPAFLVVRGTGNTVRDLEIRFFPEGIHLRAGDDHTVEGVTSRFVCEEALTLDEGTGHRVRGNTFVGHTDAAAAGGTCWRRLEGSACATDADCVPREGGARCYCGELSRLGDCSAPPPPPRWPADTPGQCYVPSRCGLDKAIQVNGGTSTIEANRLDTIGQPMSILAGTHVVASNVSCGDPAGRNVCQAYGVRGGTVTFRDNRIDHCKFGIRLDGPATVEAIGNVVTNGFVSAFQVKGEGAAYLRAAGNLLRGNGHSSESDCQRGSVVVTNPAARIDFGGGAPDGVPGPDGGTSPGGNVSCLDAGTAAAHVWNGTPCACAGDCADAGAAIGFDGGAFAPPIALPPAAAANVVDGPPLDTRVAGATVSAACATIVVPECACPGGTCPPVAEPFALARVTVRPRRAGGSRILVRGTLAGAPPGTDGFALALPGVLAEPAVWAPSDCTVAASGRVSCAAADRAGRARFTPRAGGAWAVRIVFDASPVAPRAGGGVRAALTWGGRTLEGTLDAAACRTRGAALRCRAR